MIDLKKEFKPSSLEDWKNQLITELKGAPFEKLLRNDAIEEIQYPTFHHAESSEIKAQIPGKAPFKRGFKNDSNDWDIGQQINVSNEKEDNEKALSLLMKGCDLLLFNLTNTAIIKWEVLLKDIQFEFIKIQISFKTVEQFNGLLHFFKNEIPETISFNQDFIEHENKELFQALISENKKKQIPFCYVDGFSLQQCGATTWQEIGFCLSSGHEYLVLLMEQGFTIDQAAARIHFSIGIGSNYFFEIAKIRALKENWAKIISEYKPEQLNSNRCFLTAHIGFMNKSLKDPHTNLLRQTTEAMSAVSGGIDSLVLHPYDSHSVNKTSILAERMALNISLILKEESYFNSVIDPLGGSYAIESLTDLVAEKSWKFFQELDKKGGVLNVESKLFIKDAISSKANERIAQLQSNSVSIIGINKYNNPVEVENSALDASSYLDIPTLNLERALITQL